MSDPDVEKAKRRKPKPRGNSLPQWKVILHNDDVNDAVHVARTVESVTRLPYRDCVAKTMEAHQNGQALLLVVHRERAELYQEQFANAVPHPIKTTLEPE